MLGFPALSFFGAFETARSTSFNRFASNWKTDSRHSATNRHGPASRPRAHPVSSHPPTFHGFVGQKTHVRNYRRQIAGAQARTEALLSLFLIARRGHGKSFFARALAAE